MPPNCKSRAIKHNVASTKPEKPRIFKEHELAHALLGDLTGLEIGAETHNPFGLRTRNVALPEGPEVYPEY